MYLHVSGTFSAIAYTHSNTGALTDADSTPTAQLFHNGVADGSVTVTVTHVVTGKYKLSCTIPSSGYVEGDVVSLELSATVGGISDASIVAYANITTAVPNVAAGASGGLTLGDGSGNLSAAILNRLQALVPVNLTVLASPAPTSTTFSATVSASTNYQGWETVFNTGANSNTDAIAIQTFAITGGTQGNFTLENALPNTPTAGDTFYIVGADLPKELFQFLLNLGSDYRPILSSSQTGLYALKKNTAFNNFEFALFSSSDHVTPKTGATVTATRSIDGGAFAACANNAVEIGNGVYSINLATTDLNGNNIMFEFSATGADTQLVSIVTQS